MASGRFPRTAGADARPAAPARSSLAPTLWLLLLLVLGNSCPSIASVTPASEQRHQHHYQHRRLGTTAAGKFRRDFTRSLSEADASSSPISCAVSVQWTMPGGSPPSNCQMLADVLNTAPYSSPEEPLKLQSFQGLLATLCVIVGAPVSLAARQALAAALQDSSLWQLPASFSTAGPPLTCSDSIAIGVYCDSRTAGPVVLTAPAAVGCPGSSPLPPSLPLPPSPPQPPQPPSPPPPGPPGLPPPSPRRSPPAKPPPRPPFPIISRPPPPPPPTRSYPLPGTARATGDPGSSLSSADAQAILDVHNQVRANYADQPLVWSASLAQDAQAWASNCQFKHSALQWGENIAIGYGGASNLAILWYNMEVCTYDYSKPGTFQAGHFTQVVWAGTQRIGCALLGPSNGCPQGIYNPGTKAYWSGASMLVCEYDPPGNWIDAGAYIANVKRPIVPPALCAGS